MTMTDDKRPPYSSEEIARLKYWCDRGRVVNIGANLFVTSNTAAGSVLSHRDAFFAGANFLFCLIHYVLSEGEGESPVDLERMNKVWKELEESDAELRLKLQTGISPLHNKQPL